MNHKYNNISAEKSALVFSRNLAYNLGGAERSLLEEVKQHNYATVQVLYALQNEFEGSRLFNHSYFNRDLGSEDFKLFPRFFYYEYLANRRLIKDKLSKLDFDILLAQNRWAPVAIKVAANMNKEAIYYLRDETSLGLFKNYYSGKQYVLKSLYQLLESPALKLFQRDNEEALNAATKVIVNSQFMRGLLWDLYKVDSEVVYPKIDAERLLTSYHLHKKSLEQPNAAIVMVGDTKIKGVDVFTLLAERNPEHDFYLYGKNSRLDSRSSNLVHKGWVNDPAVAYANAKVVIVPSLWDEAFGRVAVEASLLGIPVIVSNKGGLPEAVNYDSAKIANDFEDFANKLRTFL